MGKFRTEVRMIEQDGKRIYGTAYLPEGAEKVPAVILSHGYNENSDYFESYGSHFASEGVAAYAFDFCGGSPESRSSGKTTQMSVMTEKEDLKLVIANVTQWEEIDASKIALLGASQGGFVSALVAEELKEKVKGIMLLYPAFCIPDDWTDKYPDQDSIPEEIEFAEMTIGKAFVNAVDGMDIKKTFGKYANPVLLLHGDEDCVVSYHYSLIMEKQYADAKTIIFHGENHGFTEEGNQIVQNIVLGYLKDKLKF